jgi:Tfp pilus assembly protein PilF
VTNIVSSSSPAGSIETALRRAEQAVVESGGAVAAWFALAHAHWSAGRPQGALAACDAGLASHGDDPALMSAKATFLTDLDRPAEARSLFERALTASPVLPSALFGLARLAADQGAWPEADIRLQALAAAQAPTPEHHWLRGRIALGLGDAAGARAALEQLLAAQDLPPAVRAEGLLLLSEALDGLEQSAAAFEAARQGKAIQRRVYADAARGREPVARRYERLARAFENAAPADWAPAPAGTFSPPAKGHVLLVGFPRSGTTLLEQALAASPQVCALEEAPTLAAAHAEFLTSEAGVRRLAGLTAAEADTWRARYWTEVRAHGGRPERRILLDKAPAATDDLALVAKLFPDARVLFAIRDPRDVVLSCLRQNFRMNALTYAFTSLPDAAATYAACMTLADVYRRVLPLPILDVRHEALVQDFETGLREVCGFIGLGFEPAMLDVAATAGAREVRTPSAPQVRAGLNARGVGRWRRYARELAPVLPTLAPWAVRFGYRAD